MIELVSFSFNASLVRSPIRFLNDMLREDSIDSLILGVIMSSFIESYGKDRLKEYFKKKEITVEPFN